MNTTPERMKTNLKKESFPESPTKPTVVVKIKIMGPTIANELLTTKAFSTSFNLNISIPARISILPEIIRKIPITNTTFPITKIINPSLKRTFLPSFYALVLNSRQLMYKEDEFKVFDK